MLKFFFFSLLLVNGGLFAWHQGYLQDVIPSEREPARLKNQLDPEKIRLIPASSAQAILSTNATNTDAASSASSAPAASNPAASISAVPAASVSAVPAVPVAPVAPPKPPISRPETIACTEIGNFVLADAKRFETQLASLALGDRQARINIAEPSSFMVSIPPTITKDKEGADKKVGELKALGIKDRDFLVMQDENPQLKWGISLGIFSTQEAAQRHLAALNAQGVRSAKISARGSARSNKIAFQLRNIDRETRNKLDSIKAAFPTQEIRACSRGNAP